MPPRPVRSKGCKTCRRRKVKCDEARPFCKRCSNAWLACEGYCTEAGATIFVNSTIENVTVYNNVSTNVVAVQASLQSPNSGIPRSPDRPFKENMWVSFLAAHLFPGSIHRPELGSWLFEMINVDSTSLSYLTACCMGAAFYARTNGMIEEDLNDAATYYAQALRQLNKNLKDPRLWSHPVNVAASMLLGVYELMNFSTSEGFVKHAGGVGTLIKSRGAVSHMCYPARSYFVMSRMPIIMEAIVYRKRCFLAEPEWQYITTSIPKSPARDQFEFNDLMVRVPGLMADSDDAHAAAESSGAVADGFLDNFHASVVAILRDFFIWRWTWEERYPGMAYEVPVTGGSLSVDEDQQPLFGKAIYFNHYHIGRQAGLCMVAIILILHEARSWGIMNAPAEALASLSSYSKPQAANPLILPHEGMSPEEAAQEILRSVEFYLQGEHRLSGGLHLLVPLRMASPFITDARQKSWLKRVTEKMANTHGFKFSLRLQKADRFTTDWAGSSPCIA